METAIKKLFDFKRETEKQIWNNDIRFKISSNVYLDRSQ